MIPGGGLAFPPRLFIGPEIYKRPFGLILSPEIFQSPWLVLKMLARPMIPVNELEFIYPCR